MSDETPLSDEEVAVVDAWVAECAGSNERHDVRMKRRLDEIRRLRAENSKLKEQVVASGRTKEP
jgi:hypothetical protein